MTHHHQTATQWHGRTAVDRDGDKLGTIEEIYLDDSTGQPEWLLVKTGLFGSKSTFIPLQDAQENGDQIRVPFEKAQVKDAPNVDPDQQLSQEEEADLYRHYGIEYGENRSGSGLPEGTRDDAGVAGGTGLGEDVGRDRDREGTVGHDTSGPTTDDAMTRSEEEIRVGTARQEAGRARLRKYVVEEQVSETVPVSHEEVRVESEPVTDANLDQAIDGPEISEEEHEVVLNEEVPVVEKETVAKERVRLTKDTVTDEETVNETARKEQIETEGDVRR
jgi:uncharacterized protein (TIGR02271 family)